MMLHSAKGSDSSQSMRLRDVCRVYETGIGVSNRRCAAEAACTISAQCTPAPTHESSAAATELCGSTLGVLHKCWSQAGTATLKS